MTAFEIRVIRHGEDYERIAIVDSAGKIKGKIENWLAKNEDDKRILKTTKIDKNLVVVALEYVDDPDPITWLGITVERITIE